MILPHTIKFPTEAANLIKREVDVPQQSFCQFKFNTMDSTFQSPSSKKQQSKSLRSQDLREATSSQKLHKMSIDKFGRIHRESFHGFKNFAPLVRVDLNTDKENARQSEGQQGQKAELGHLIELRERKKIDLLRAEQEKNAKVKQIQSLIEKVQTAKMDNAELRRLVLTSNELKHKARWQKQKYQNTLKSLTIQAHQAIKKQDRELITLAHQYFLANKQKEDVREKTSALKQKTISLRDEERNLDELINQQSKKVEERRQTITQLNYDIKRVEADVSVSALQISVLRMQVNPCLRVGFSTVSLDPEGDRKRILDKSYNTWPKNKIKTLSRNEIRDYLVMQLYPSWKRMLSKISSEFIGYQQLLCYEMIEGQQKLPDLSLYLPQKVQSNRNTSGKARSFIITYSPIEDNQEEIIQIAIGLGGLSNGILQIDEVRVQDVEDNQQIQINYTFMDTARTKKFEVVRLKELTRQLVMKWLPGKDDRCLLMKFEVPLIPGSHKAQYQEVYDLIRRWK